MAATPASRPVMAAMSESLAIMAATPEPRPIMAATPGSSPMVAATQESLNAPLLIVQRKAFDTGIKGFGLTNDVDTSGVEG